MALTGTAHGQEITYEGLQGEIPDGANRIILEQRVTTPAEMYVDALNYVQRSEWEVTASEETEDLTELEDILSRKGEGPLAFTAQGEVPDDMALRIAVNVESYPAGGRLIASADYANDLPAENWQDAAWTSGRARRAFFEALEVLRRTAYDAARFEVGVAIEAQN